MTIEDVRSIAASGESEGVEFKNPPVNSKRQRGPFAPSALYPAESHDT